ncbi:MULTISPECIES: diguanylate cyclase [Pantoea]|uniref:diguanylate cyclase n=1 Tax=Pantoea TaxID=53335 RepID=UPI001F179BED|nr:MULTISPECIES: diguanylate cyclase [Pantoea]UIL50772.1 diguanylate cyclase [Pantoea agglomerans]
MLLLLYFVLPVWLIAGFADWICHRATDIENTTGLKETWIHILMFLEMGLPLLSALFLEVNALVIGFMIVLFFCHEATALWDVSYAVTAREVKPVEQHVHSFLEMVPLMALLLVISRHWPQFQALFGLGDESPRFELKWRADPLPTGYIIFVLSAIFLLEMLPYLEEYWRGKKARRRAANNRAAGE